MRGHEGRAPPSLPLTPLWSHTTPHHSAINIPADWPFWHLSLARHSSLTAKSGTEDWAPIALTDTTQGLLWPGLWDTEAFREPRSDYDLNYLLWGGDNISQNWHRWWFYWGQMLNGGSRGFKYLRCVFSGALEPRHMSHVSVWPKSRQLSHVTLLISHHRKLEAKRNNITYSHPAAVDSYESSSVIIKLDVEYYIRSRLSCDMERDVMCNQPMSILGVSRHTVSSVPNNMSSHHSCHGRHHRAQWSRDWGASLQCKQS